MKMNSNDQKFMAEKIRSEYIQKKTTELDELRALDAKVKRPANLFAGVFGTVSVLVMGSGMSLIMTDIGDMLDISNSMAVGIIIGIIGMGMALINYPIYKKILKGRREEYAAEIMQLSDRIVKEE